MSDLTPDDRASAPQTASQAAEVGAQLRAEGRTLIDQLRAYSTLKAKAERWLEEEEAIAHEVEGFADRRTNEDERLLKSGRHTFRAHASDVAWLVKACESAGLDGLDGEKVETIADLRLVVKLLKGAINVSERLLKAHDVDGRHQVSVTSWAKAEYAGVMDDRMDDAPRERLQAVPPRPPHPAEVVS